MDITLCNALFGAASRPSLGGSVFSEKSSPGKTQACLYLIDSSGQPGVKIWSAYRRRSDGEGQRQLEEAMIRAASSRGSALLHLAPTSFSRRLR